MSVSARMSIRIPRPKAKASGLTLFPRAPAINAFKGSPSYKKSALTGDPVKFGNFGFDINMQGPGRFGGPE